MTIHVIGIGQRHRGDDEIGLLVAERVRELSPFDVEVCTSMADPMALLVAFEGRECCVVVDCAQHTGAPGSVLRLTPPAVNAARGGATSSHGNALSEALALGTALGGLPPGLRIVLVTGAVFAIGAEPSASVRAAIPDAVAAVLAEVEKLKAEAHERA